MPESRLHQEIVEGWERSLVQLQGIDPLPSTLIRNQLASEMVVAYSGALHGMDVTEVRLRRRARTRVYQPAICRELLPDCLLICMNVFPLYLSADGGCLDKA